MLPEHGSKKGPAVIAQASWIVKSALGVVADGHADKEVLPEKVQIKVILLLCMN
jgi:hypothetical protein